MAHRGFDIGKFVVNNLGVPPKRTKRTPNPHPPSSEFNRTRVKAVDTTQRGPASTPTPPMKPTRGGNNSRRVGSRSTSAPSSARIASPAGPARFFNQLDKAVVASRGKRDKRFR